MEFDDLYQYTGEIGVYQICVLVFFFAFDLYALDATTMIFVGAYMPHWCRVEPLSNLSYSRQKYIAIPYESDASDQDQGGYSSCKMYQLNYSLYSDEELMSWNRSLMIDDTTPVVDCTQWVYEQSTFISTIASRFDLVCGQDLIIELISAIYMGGSLLNSFCSGYIADRVGRKLASLIFLGVKLVGVLMSTFAPNIIVFVIGRFVLGIGSNAVYLITYVLLMESVGPKYRALVGSALQISTSIGFMFQPLIAQQVRDDVKFQIAAMLPAALFLSITFVVEESLRWLIVNKRYDDANRVLKHICQSNNRPLPPESVDLTTINTEEKTASCLLLMTQPRLRMQTVLLHFLWFTSSLAWFSLALNTGNLAGDVFTNTTISAAMEVPSIIVIVFLLEVKFLGRRINCCATYLLTGISCLACIPLSLLGYDTIVTGFAIVAKSIATAAWTIVVIYSSELYPTEVRNSAMGTSMMLSCFANIASPYVGEPLAKIWPPIPYIIIGSAAVISGFLCLFLPETLGRSLPDTIQQAEEIARKVKTGPRSSAAAADNAAFDDDSSQSSGEQQKSGVHQLDDCQLQQKQLQQNIEDHAVTSNGLNAVLAAYSQNGTVSPAAAASPPSTHHANVTTRF